MLRLSNIISLEDLDEDEDYEALLEDLREGCEKLGTVVNMHVPRIHVGLDAFAERVERREGDSRTWVCVRSVLVGY